MPIWAFMSGSWAPLSSRELKENATNSYILRGGVGIGSGADDADDSEERRSHVAPEILTDWIQSVNIRRDGEARKAGRHVAGSSVVVAPAPVLDQAKSW
jgi:hypothetical protein